MKQLSRVQLLIALLTTIEVLSTHAQNSIKDDSGNFLKQEAAKEDPKAAAHQNKQQTPAQSSGERATTSEDNTLTAPAVGTAPSEVIQGRQWTIQNQEDFASVENAVLHLKFAFIPQGQRGAEGWFKGGGGQDGAIVELYFKPTSETRNLIPRNGTWGGKKDALDPCGMYQNDGEMFYAWSDCYGPDGKHQPDKPFLYKEAFADNVNKNTAISMFKREDPYSGFMIEDRNGNDPDIVVMNGEKATWLSPFDSIARKVGGRNYVETGMFTPFYGKDLGTYAGICWFYATIRCCPPVYNDPMLWPDTLGAWDESFHVLLRRDLGADDYLPLWRAWARDVEKQAPFDVTGATVRLDEVDRLYHLTAKAGTKRVQFRWKRGSDADRVIDYRTAFVVENFPQVGNVWVEGKNAPKLLGYPDSDDGNVLIVLEGPQSGVAEPLLITVERTNR